jgi:hypothetical protein
LTTKKFFYLELKKNRQFYRLSAEQIHEITIRLPAPPMTNGNNYEQYFAFKNYLISGLVSQLIASMEAAILKSYVTTASIDWPIEETSLSPISQNPAHAMTSGNKYQTSLIFLGNRLHRLFPLVAVP